MKTGSKEQAVQAIEYGLSILSTPYNPLQQKLLVTTLEAARDQIRSIEKRVRRTTDNGTPRRRGRPRRVAGEVFVSAEGAGEDPKAVTAATAS